MAKRFAVILAAGKGTRMKSKLYKVLHPIAGRPMIQHVHDQLEDLQLDEIVTVVGHGAESVIKMIDNQSEFVIQQEQLGTGHAVLQVEDLLKDKVGTTIVVCGDTPLITNDTYTALFDHHERSGAMATILTAQAENPTGYGRVIRNEENQVERIVEHDDASKQELIVDEINTGTYCFDNKALFAALKEVSNDNVQGEYYLPDVIEILRKQSNQVSAYLTPDFEETIGINDRVALAKAEKTMRKRINEQHMNNGVTMIDPDHTYIGLDVKIGQDVTIHPNVTITGSTIIEADVEIGSHTEIANCTIQSGTTIKQSTMMDSTIGEEAEIGPFAYVRPESKIGRQVKIGQFVEIKKAVIGDYSKVPHLSYIGDAEIGENVNIGCGTITVNFDGRNKFTTVIKDDAFIGCNSNLVAPITIGEGAFVAAGSTITKDVQADALAVARGRQTNKEGYAAKIRSHKKD